MAVEALPGRWALSLALLLALQLSGSAFGADDPGSESPTTDAVGVSIDLACVERVPSPEGLYYNGSFAGRTDGPVLYVAYALAEHYVDGSVNASTWIFPHRYSLLVGIHDPSKPIYGTGPGGREDFSDWAISWYGVAAFRSSEAEHVETVERIVLWVRAFEDLERAVWNQASLVIYTREGGFVCDEGDALPAVMVVGGLGVAALGVGAIVRHKRAVVNSVHKKEMPAHLSRARP